MRPSLQFDYGAVSKVIREHGCVDGGTHQNHTEVGKGLDHLTKNNQQEIRLNGNLEDNCNRESQLRWQMSS